MCVLFQLLLLLLPAAARPLPLSPHSVSSAHWRRLRASCAATPACRVQPTWAVENCAAECSAPSCYSIVYTVPLEPGEIDANRQAQFAACLKVLENTLKANGEWPPQLNDQTQRLSTKG